jgi:hypothetical protein
MRVSRRIAILSLAGVLLIAGLWLAPAFGQRSSGRMRLWYDIESAFRAPEGAEFVFARVRYGTGGGYYRGDGWAHDYPDAEEHILQVASEATGINLHKMSYVVVDLESEDIFKYPFLYFSEVGEMGLSEEEVANFREYLNRGGFAMIDDFDSQISLEHFLREMKRLFPDRDFPRLELEHPIFHTFYEIPTLAIDPPYNSRDGGRPAFYGYYDDRGELLMIINHNNDVGDFWEWIDQPRYPLQPSTEALRFGINYFVFALTH